ncbi:LysR family transcriptional regulator [Paracoccus sp. R12_2]|uniref:LysR family transcriptional regulator n=1 Tax=unclassified Paracoccus (in: a-proteobacteria) TaxID=2688777 RepID=UPI0032B01E48
MLDYRALHALAEILRRGSFEAAAHALSVTPSAISQRIRLLEERCGSVLIDRGPPLRGTPAGLRLATHLDQVRLMESALMGAATPDCRFWTSPSTRTALQAGRWRRWPPRPV